MRPSARPSARYASRLWPSPMASERSTRTASGTPRKSASEPRLAAANAFSPPRADGRRTSRSERRCPPSASLCSRRVATQTASATHDELHEREDRRRSQVEHPDGLVVDLRLEGRVLGAAEDQDDAERGEARTGTRSRPRTPSAGASSGSVTSRRLRNGARAERRGSLGDARVEAGPDGADDADDDRDVEEDVRDEDRRPARARGRPGSTARNASATTTVGSTNGTVTSARDELRPRNAKRPST